MPHFQLFLNLGKKSNEIKNNWIMEFHMNLWIIHNNQIQHVMKWKIMSGLKGSQLAKMKKYIPYIPLPQNL